MEARIKELKTRLTQIARIYSQLHETLLAEHNAMAAVDVKLLSEITQTKESCLSAIMDHENEREALLQNMALSLGQKSTDLTMSRIIDLTTDEALRVRRFL